MNESDILPSPVPTQNSGNAENENLEISINDPPLSCTEETEEDVIIVESKNKELLKLIKIDIEEKILSKLKHSFADSASRKNIDKTYRINFSSNYILDSIGNSIKTGETSVCEGWHVPKYENEYQNLLALPYTEDSPSETMKIKKPSQECFNCMATNHKITECPIKYDQERIQLNRKNFASQSMAAKDQAVLFSNRYTDEEHNKHNRGFTPGKISDNLREALQLNKKQLPPYIYIMRELGYPIGWLKEAMVRKSGLTVVDGSTTAEDTQTEAVESGEEKDEAENAEYDPEKIYDFPGFNQPVPDSYIDEWREFGVRRFNDSLSKKRYLNTIKLASKKLKTRSDIKKEESSTSIASINEHVASLNVKSEIEDQTTITASASSGLINENEEYGKVLTEISGTPIVVNLSGVSKVPNADNFSIDISDFKPYDMLNCQTGNYQNIVKITRDFKQKQ